jgi:hydrogenase maturation protease
MIACKTSGSEGPGRHPPALDAAAKTGTRVLVLGYGNPGRQDDGLGPAAATLIDEMGWSGVTAFDNYQLNIENALDVAEHDVVWFVDAAKTGPSPYAVRQLAPSSNLDFTSHLVRPETILGMAGHYFGGTPDAYLLAIRGYAFEFIEALTPQANDNLQCAAAMLAERISVVIAAVTA